MDIMDVLLTRLICELFADKEKRPKNSRMNKDKLDEMGFERLPSWQDALSRYLAAVGGPV